MVSAPFPRSHENGLPRNYHLREATKMTMLRMSAKWCSKKKTAATAKNRVSAFFFCCFLFLFYFFFSFLFIHSSAILFFSLAILFFSLAILFLADFSHQSGGKP
jgi:hypothetical protein